jgi:hypothetical protein
MRYLIAQEWSASKAPPGSIYDSSLILFGGDTRKGTDGILIGVYIFTVTIASSKIVLSADIPLLLVHINDIAFYADGALQPTCFYDSTSIGFSLVNTVY